MLFTVAPDAKLIPPSIFTFVPSQSNLALVSALTSVESQKSNAVLTGVSSLVATNCKLAIEGDVSSVACPIANPSLTSSNTNK